MDAFESIRKLLFDVLVVDKLLFEEEKFDVGDDSLPDRLMVVPEGPRVPILIRRPSISGRYWDQEKDMVIGPDEIKLAFIDYYDFYEHPIKDFRYYLCKVLSFSGHIEYEGREALIEVLAARVFYDEQCDNSSFHGDR